MEQYHLRLSSVIGLVIFAQSSTKTYTGTKEELEKTYKKVLITNLLVGWWSIFCVVWNPMALYHNYKAIQQLRAL